MAGPDLGVWTSGRKGSGPVGCNVDFIAVRCTRLTLAFAL
jgi:hypothetical protein